MAAASMGMGKLGGAGLLLVCRGKGRRRTRASWTGARHFLFSPVSRWPKISFFFFACTALVFPARTLWSPLVSVSDGLGARKRPNSFAVTRHATPIRTIGRLVPPMSRNFGDVIVKKNDKLKSFVLISFLYKIII
jgi:hypothetical protein